MRFDQVQDFIANLMSRLGLKECPEGFNRESIPSWLLDQSFTIDFGTISGAAANHQMHSYRMPFTINVYFKNYSSPQDLRKCMMSTAFDINEILLKPQVRLQESVKGLVPSSTTLAVLDRSNDNEAILSVGFELTLLYQFN